MAVASFPCNDKIGELKQRFQRYAKASYVWTQAEESDAVDLHDAAEDLK